MYVLRNFDNGNIVGDKADYGKHERIKKLYEKQPDLGKLIEGDVANRRGRLLITSTLSIVDR